MKDNEDCGGPYVGAAFLCETVIEDKTGAHSSIRVIDRLTVNSGPQAPAVMPSVGFSANLVVMVKSGRARGRSEVTIRPESPAGIKLQEMRLPIQLEGEERGSQLQVKFDLELADEGLYWFDILLDGAMMTRIPLRVVYQPIRVGGEITG